MPEKEKITSGEVTYKITIHLSTGETREHIYPYYTIKDTGDFTDTINRMTYSIARPTWFWKIIHLDYIPGILVLKYPDTTYNTSFITFFSYERISKTG